MLKILHIPTSRYVVAFDYFEELFHFKHTVWVEGRTQTRSGVRNAHTKLYIMIKAKRDFLIQFKDADLPEIIGDKEFFEFEIVEDNSTEI